MKKSTICLNMIVKDEAHCIKRCFDSVKHLIDYWVIVDTGSTDGTQDIIRAFKEEVPGALYESPWVNFAHNRNEAMELAKDCGDYLLFIDADDYLVCEEGFSLPDLVDDAYAIIQKETKKSTCREHALVAIVKNNGQFKWQGRIHEYLRNSSCNPQPIKALNGLYNQYTAEGARNIDKDKCKKDLELLKGNVEDDPNDSRSVFYLARTYFSMENYYPAIFWFQKRAQMGDDPQEVYYSLLYIAICHLRLGLSQDCVRSFEAAYWYRPSRAEAPYELARYYTEKKLFFHAYLFAKIALLIPKTVDNLFVETWVQDWGARLYCFISAQSLGQQDEAKEHLENLISNPQFPEEIRKEFELDKWVSFYNLTKEI